MAKVITFNQDNLPCLIDCKDVSAVFVREDRHDNFYNPYKIDIVFNSGHIRTFCYNDPRYAGELYKAILNAKKK